MTHATHANIPHTLLHTHIHTQAAAHNPILLESLLSHIHPHTTPPTRPSPSRDAHPKHDPAIALALLNYALAEDNEALLRELLQRGIPADGRDMVDVPLLHAAVRAECGASLLTVLLQVCVFVCVEGGGRVCVYVCMCVLVVVVMHYLTPSISPTTHSQYPPPPPPIHTHSMVRTQTSTPHPSMAAKTGPWAPFKQPGTLAAG